MALREYKCLCCHDTVYVFDNEFCDERGGYNCEGPFPHIWRQSPPKFTTILATSMLMLEEPQLDSLISVYELDRQLTIEAREQKELELFQEVRRNA